MRWAAAVEDQVAGQTLMVHARALRSCVRHAQICQDSHLNGHQAERTLVVHLQVLSIGHAPVHVSPNLNSDKAGLALVSHQGMLQLLRSHVCCIEGHRDRLP